MDASAAQPLTAVMPVYVVAQTPVPNLGAGGLPRANPHFAGRGENNIRHPRFCCIRWQPGPNIPLHWFNGQMGWTTFYYTDVERFDWETQRNGAHRCQVPLPSGGHCGHEVRNEGCCNETPCWCPGVGAPYAMAAHLHAHHGIAAPLKRQWATDLFDTQGCFDVWCCSPCTGSRQMMALSGYADTFNIWWCLFFVLAGIRHYNGGGNRQGVYWVPPHFLVALLTRFSVVELQNIDEGPCKTGCIVTCCAICSAAQTYREMSAAGVWPGGTVCSTEPPLVAMAPQTLKIV